MIFISFHAARSILLFLCENCFFSERLLTFLRKSTIIYKVFSQKKE